MYVACLVLILLSAVLINSTATFAAVLIGEFIFGSLYSWLYIIIIIIIILRYLMS